jgi:hypothetical protein
MNKLEVFLNNVIVLLLYVIIIIVIWLIDQITFEDITFFLSFECFDKIHD